MSALTRDEMQSWRNGVAKQKRAVPYPGDARRLEAYETVLKQKELLAAYVKGVVDAYDRGLFDPEAIADCAEDALAGVIGLD